MKAEKLWNFVEVSLLIKRRMLCWQQFHRIRLAYFVISFKFLFFIYFFYCQKIQSGLSSSFFFPFIVVSIGNVVIGDILNHSIVVICLCFWGL